MENDVGPKGQIGATYIQMSFSDLFASQILTFISHVSFVVCCLVALQSRDVLPSNNFSLADILPPPGQTMKPNYWVKWDHMGTMVSLCSNPWQSLEMAKKMLERDLNPQPSSLQR